MALGLISKIEDRLISNNVPKALVEKWRKPISETLPMEDLNRRITELCRDSDREVILMVDEVDRAADNQLFLLFLGLLRTKYLRRNAGRDDTFKSVVLAGVHDIKNLKMKIRQEDSQKYNSPWNIAADFDVDMGFSAAEIASMLNEYENDCHTGMDIHAIAEDLYAYTGGYPFLVSWLCKRIDEGRFCWSKDGVWDAVKEMLHGTNTLFDDIIKNLENHPDFRKLVESVLVQGEAVPFVVSNPEIARGVMYGIFRKTGGQVSISNLIFETYIYEYLISISKTQELKLWHGAKRERDGYDQLAGYLDARGLERGYLVSFCENAKVPKENQEIVYKGHKIYEVVIAYRESNNVEETEVG